MTTEPVEITVGGKTYEIHEEDQAWLRQQVDELTAGQSIRAHRLCEEWTLEEAARKMGVTPQMLHSYETGKRYPSVEKALVIAEALGMAPLALVCAVLQDQVRRAGVTGVKVRLAG